MAWESHTGSVAAQWCFTKQTCKAVIHTIPSTNSYTSKNPTKAQQTNKAQQQKNLNIAFQKKREFAILGLWGRAVLKILIIWVWEGKAGGRV